MPWVGRERAGEELVHKLDDGRYLKHWYLAVAEKIARPEGDRRKDEPWVHVNIEQQTLVLYRGDSRCTRRWCRAASKATKRRSGCSTSAPSTCRHDERHRPGRRDDRYSIEDVPWTEYFSGSIALHGAFWHGGFGLRHSHGCVNLSPLDAHRTSSITPGRGRRGLARRLYGKTGLPRE